MSPVRAFLLREEWQRHVALTAVAGDRDDPLAGHLRTSCELQSRMERGASRNPDQQPLAARRCTGGLQRRLVLVGKHLVDHRAVEYAGHEPRADALNLVRSG